MPSTRSAGDPHQVAVEGIEGVLYLVVPQDLPSHEPFRCRRPVRGCQQRYLLKVPVQPGDEALRGVDLHRDGLEALDPGLVHHVPVQREQVLMDPRQVVVESLHGVRQVAELGADLLQLGVDLPQLGGRFRLGLS